MTTANNGTVDPPPIDITQHVVFATISVHWWRGKFKIKEADVIVSGSLVRPGMSTLPNWCFMPDYWTQRFNRVDGQLRCVLSSEAPSYFAVRHLSILPAHKAGAIFDRLTQMVENSFDPLVKEFLQAWPALRVERLAELTPGQRAQVEPWVPAQASTLRRFFHVQQYVVPVDGSVLKAGAAMERANQVAVRANAFIDAAAYALSEPLNQELMSAVDSLAQQLDAQGVIRNASLTSLKRTFEKIKGFSFAADATVLQRIAEVESRLDISAQDLNKDNRDGTRAIAADLIGALQRLRQAGDVEAAAVSRFGRQLRSIDIG
jgi:hypothetical protein